MENILPQVVSRKSTCQKAEADSESGVFVQLTLRCLPLSRIVLATSSIIIICFIIFPLETLL
jgi:hypothetical protein